MRYRCIYSTYYICNICVYIYIYMGAGKNTRHGSRSRAHTRSILHDPYPDPYLTLQSDPYPTSIPHLSMVYDVFHFVIVMFPS